MTARPWTDHYVQGTKTDIAPIQYKHLPDMFRYVASQFGHRIAFTQCMANGMDASLTYAETDRLSDAFAAYLRETVGLEAGDRVAVQLPNCLAYIVAAFGILKAGCVLVNTNPLYTAPEMTHQFGDSGARALVILDMFADRLPTVIPATKIETVVLVGISELFSPFRRTLIRTVQKYVRKEIPKPKVEHTPFSAALKAGQAAVKTAKVPHYVAHLELDHVAVLQYTGGTTGVSKGAMLTHRNLLANTMQLEEVSQHFLRTGEECVLTALPYYHIFAFTVNLLLFYAIGARDVMVPSPRPITNLQKAWARYPISWFTGVNTLYNGLLNEEWFRASPPRHLVASLAGGMALHSAVAARWKEVTGTPVVEGYGLTETSPVVTFNPIGGTVKDGTIGIPLPSTDLVLVDETGTPVAEGEPGEILVKGPQVMPGYWNRPDETAKVVDADGWIHTGDIATMDADGYVRIVDRKKDMILVSGFNVYPNEVEEVIAQLPEVAEVGVIGVPDERTGEAVKAVVVKKSPALTAEDIIRHCREQLTSYKVPKQVEFRAELPKSNVGKILRKDLRAAERAAEKAAV